MQITNRAGQVRYFLSLGAKCVPPLTDFSWEMDAMFGLIAVVAERPARPGVSGLQFAQQPDPSRSGRIEQHRAFAFGQ
ncbi:hypothetical protein [Actinoallomurus sp. NPDC052274]|uniref:hypothetical protein n=1 Tax=Actinoallomurus sp. NPDC052274 TaxID=3155420 RepID=UPI00341D4249